MSRLNLFTLNPLTRKQIKRFKEIKRGYWSLMLLSALLILSLCAEVLINSKALVVRYQGEYFFPIFSDVYSGSNFGLDYAAETNYRDLQQNFEYENNGDFVLLPLVPWNAFEQDFSGSFPPNAPDFEAQHYLCLLYTSPSPRDRQKSRMPSSA